MTTTPDDDYTPEERKLIDWRYHRLVQLGVSKEDAANLSTRFEVSYQDLQRLVESGCDVETAVRIVA